MNIINSIYDLEPFLKYPAKEQFYRGQSSTDYKLWSGISRFKDNGYNVVEILKKEKDLFNLFIDYIQSKEVTIANYNELELSNINYWNWYFQAQHLGLKTRLMDWSVDYKIALLFAINQNENADKDALFTIFSSPQEIIITDANSTELYKSHPLEISQSFMINPTTFYKADITDNTAHRRIRQQSGKFLTVSNEDLFIPLNDNIKFQEHIQQFIIPQKSKKNILKELEVSDDYNLYHNSKSYLDEKLLELNYDVFI